MNRPALADRSLADVARQGRHFLAFPCARRTHQLCWICSRRSGDERIMVGTGRSRRASARIRRLGSPHRHVARQVDKTFRWALYDREPLPTWTKGRLTLLGDAAHPMLPHLGQGANQSIEDGMALATILAHADAQRAGGAARLRAAPPRARGHSSARCARERPALRLVLHGSGVRDAEITAHAAFRRRLYDYDVVPSAGCCDGLG